MTTKAKGTSIRQKLINLSPLAVTGTLILNCPPRFSHYKISKLANSLLEVIV